MTDPSTSVAIKSEEGEAKADPNQEASIERNTSPEPPETADHSPIEQATASIIDDPARPVAIKGEEDDQKLDSQPASLRGQPA